MEQHCPVCNSEDVFKLLAWQKEFNIYKCKNCLLVYTHPLPTDEELDEFYQGFLFRKPDENKIARQVEKKKVELGKLFDLHSTDDIDNKDFLDFGGGVGLTTKAARDMGLNAHYFDVDEESVVFLKDKLGIESGFVFTDVAEIAGKTFDFILADNVIEHDKYPMEFMGKLYNFLKPDGVLVVKTPHACNTETVFYPAVNLAGYFLRSLKYNNIRDSIRGYMNRWWHCDPPRHLYSFSEKSFREILKALEISDYKIDHYRLSLFKYSIVEFLFSKNKGAKTIITKILLLILLPFELVCKLLQVFLTSLNLITPSGIIVKIKKAVVNR